MPILTARSLCSRSDSQARLSHRTLTGVPHEKFRRTAKTRRASTSDRNLRKNVFILAHPSHGTHKTTHAAHAAAIVSAVTETIRRVLSTFAVSYRIPTDEVTRPQTTHNLSRRR
jgi:hypothetical protein